MLFLFLPLFYQFIIIQASNRNKCSSLDPGSQQYLQEQSTLNTDARKLIFNNTNCWIRNVTSERAKKCLSTKNINNIIFFGDSMSRDFGLSLVHLMKGKSIHDLPETNFDHRSSKDWAKIGQGINSTQSCDCFGHKLKTDFRGCRETHRCVIYTTYSHLNQWKIIIYTHGSYLSDGWENLSNILSNLEKNSTSPHRSIIILGHVGFHGIDADYRKYRTLILEPLLTFMKPTNQTSTSPFTPLFIRLFINTNYDSLKDPMYMARNQQMTVDITNRISKQFLIQNKLLYFDNTIISRFQNASADGVHLKEWANLLNIQILLHYLCDNQWELKKSLFQKKMKAKGGGSYLNS